MELYKEILLNRLQNEEMQIVFPNLEVDATKIVELECYKALQEIKAVLADDSLEDDECFTRIEEIVCIFESIGSDAGERHDFG